MSPAPYTLARSSGLPDERFATLSALRARIAELAGGADLRLTIANVARRARPAGPCIKVHRVAPGQPPELVGYAFGFAPNLAPLLTPLQDQKAA